MARRAWLYAGAVGLAAIGLVLLARGGRDRRAQTRAEGEIVSLVRRPEPLAPAGVEPAEPRGSRVELRAADAPDALTGAPEPADVLRVRVVRELDREPLAGASVSLSPRRDATPGWFAGTTDAAGICAFDLRGANWTRGELAFARVTTTEPGPFHRSTTDECELFTGSVPIADEIVLVAATPTVLRGRVLVEPAGRGRAGVVQAFEPTHGAVATPVFLGRADVDPWNAFAIRVSPGRAVPVVELEVGFEGIALTRRLPWSELVSEDGAEIRVELGELALLVVDEHGEPVAEADVRALPVEHGEAAPLTARTPASGELRRTVPAGTYVVCAGKSGFAAGIERLSVVSGSAGTHHWVELRALAARDTLRGRVVLADGRAVTGAIVTAWPSEAEGDLAVATISQVRSAEDGLFELAVDAGRELTLAAYDREHGLSDELRFVPDGPLPVLVIRPQGSLRLELLPPESPTEFARGLIEIVLVDREVDHAVSTHAFTLPYEIDELPAGDYNVYFLARGWNAYAEGTARVIADEVQELQLPSSAARWVRGSLLESSGEPSAEKGLRIELPEWPDTLEELWSTASSADGSFELPLGRAGLATLEILDADGVTMPVSAGEGQLVRLP